MSKMPVISNLNSSNLKAKELMLRLIIITLLKFSVLMSLNLDMQSKSVVEVILQLSVILDFSIISLISILVSEFRDCQKTKLLLTLFTLYSDSLAKCRKALSMTLLQMKQKLLVLHNPCSNLLTCFIA